MVAISLSISLFFKISEAKMCRGDAQSMCVYLLSYNVSSCAYFLNKCAYNIDIIIINERQIDVILCPDNILLATSSGTRFSAEKSRRPGTVFCSKSGRRPGLK